MEVMNAPGPDFEFAIAALLCRYYVCREQVEGKNAEAAGSSDGNIRFALLNDMKHSDSCRPLGINLLFSRDRRHVAVVYMFLER